MTSNRIASLAFLAAATLAAASARAGSAPPATRPSLELPGQTLWSRMQTDPCFGVKLVGVGAAAFRDRLRVQATELGSVAEDPVTGLRIVQRQQWSLPLGIMLVEQQIVQSGPKDVQVESLAAADWTFRPARGANGPDEGQPPTLHVLEPGLGVHAWSVLPDAPVRIGPKEALPMLVLGDERRAGGLAVAMATTGPWELQANVDKARRLHVRITAGQDERGITLKPGQSVRLPPLALTTFAGSWPNGAARLREFWASGYVQERWEELRGHVGDLSVRATAHAEPAKARFLLARANFFVPCSMLPCRIPASPAKLGGPALLTAFRSYLPGAWREGLMPEGLTGPAREALQATADLRASVAPVLEDLYLRLLPLAAKNDQWDALQFHSRRHDAGVVLLFRQASPQPRQTIQLRSLRAAGIYRLWDAAGPDSTSLTRGRDLMTKGINVALPPDGSSVLRYQSVVPQRP